MLQLIRNNSPYTVLILAIGTLIVKFQALMQVSPPQPVAGLPMYNLIIRATDLLLDGSRFGYALLALLMLFLQALYLNTILIRQRLVSRPSHIPVFTFLLLTSLHPSFNAFNNMLLLTWCMLGAMDMISRFATPVHTRKYIFNAGFWIGIGTLFHFAAAGYVLLVILALASLRAFNPAEWIVLLLGLILPAYFLTGILFLTGDLGLLRAWPGTLSLPSALPADPLPLILTASGMTVLAVAGLIATVKQTGKAPTFVRRSWGVIVAWWIISLVLATCMEPHDGSAFLISIPALSLIAAQPMFPENKKRFSIFTFWLSAGILVLCLVAAYR